MKGTATGILSFALVVSLAGCTQCGGEKAAPEKSAAPEKKAAPQPKAPAGAKATAPLDVLLTAESRGDGLYTLSLSATPMTRADEISIRLALPANVILTEGLAEETTPFRPEGIRRVYQVRHTGRDAVTILAGVTLIQGDIRQAKSAAVDIGPAGAVKAAVEADTVTTNKAGRRVVVFPEETR